MARSLHKVFFSTGPLLVQPPTRAPHYHLIFTAFDHRLSANSIA